MSGLNCTDTNNTLVWVSECRRRNSNAIANTFTGRWLGIGLRIIEKQYYQIQEMHNDAIDRTAIERTSEEIKALLHDLDSRIEGKFGFLAWQSASTIRRLLSQIEELRPVAKEVTDERNKGN